MEEGNECLSLQSGQGAGNAKICGCLEEILRLISSVKGPVLFVVAAVAENSMEFHA